MDAVCRHCHVKKVNRPRGLCWTCYHTPGLRERCESTSKFARRGVPDFNGRHQPAPWPTEALPRSQEKVAVLEERARAGVNLWHRFDATVSEDTTMPLTADDVKHGAHWLVIGTRPDGDRCVLWTGLQRAKALAKAEDFRRQLEDYASIDVESDDPNAKEPPVSESNGNQIEAIKAAHERVKAARETAAPAPAKPWGAMHRGERAQAVRKLVQELGADKTASDVVTEGLKRGMTFRPNVVYATRRLLGFTGTGTENQQIPSPKPSPRVPAPERGPSEVVIRQGGQTLARANGCPSYGIGRKLAQTQTPAATPVEPQPTGTLDEILEGVQLLGLAMTKLGGKANTLRTLETLSTWSEQD